MLGMGGMILAWLVDQVPEWGGGEQYVRFGVLLGVGCYLGMGWGIRERGSRLARRVLEGAVTGGVIGLLAAFGAEVSTVGMVAGMEPETMLIVPPVVWGAVVGWTVTGGRECLSGSQDLAAALRERWPLVVGVILVVVNAVGSVITMLP